MRHPRYKDLGIVSAKKPYKAQLFWELNNGYLLLVDSTSRRDLLISTDKGDNWDTFGTGSFSSGKISDDRNIIAAFFDRGNDLIYFIGWEVGVDGDKIQCWKLNVSTFTASDIGNSIDADNAPGDAIGIDVWVRDNKIEVLLRDDNGGSLRWEVFQWVDPNWVFKAFQTLQDTLYIPNVIIGTNGFFVTILEATHSATIQRFDGTDLSTRDAINNVDGPSDDNMLSMSYDGIDILSFPLFSTGDAENRLFIWSITGTEETKLSAYNVALMLDRNAAELEKGFSIGASETVYEIKARLGGIRVLQDISVITDAVIIAITDNFLMNNDGDMFEFTDVTNEISTILYNDGIIGIPKKGNFTVHPDFHINWNKGDSIKIYDQYDQLEFHGLITDKNRNSRGIYVYKIDSFTNEIHRTTYSITYSGDDLDTKQKDIIDNACDFCYRSSSIVGTTTTFNYVYNRAIIYLFWLGRRLERQVPYIEPDGKIWTKAHDGLVRNDMIYPGTYNFKDDADGAEPEGWVSNNDADCTTTVIASFNGHRKVLQLSDENNGGNCDIDLDFGDPLADDVHEFWFTKDSIINDEMWVTFNEGGTRLFIIRFDNNDIYYYDGAWQTFKLNHIVANTWIHVKIVPDDSANTFDGYIDGVLEVNNGSYENNTTVGIEKITIITINADTDYKCYIDAWGTPTRDTAYNIGDNEVAWDINNNWQDVQFIDIPSIEETIQGFFDGNTGITRNTIRYRDNAQTIRPVAATRDPIEQLQGILPLNEFRDPKIEESTEADQLGDNRYAIWSADTLFLGLRVLGQGYLQPGKTIHVENTGQITVAESHLLLLSFVRDPKNDVYSQMILSDNIIFPSEFTNLDNTSPQQTHTGIVQSFENQADIIAHLTKEGGLALRLTNKTGVASVKGTIVEAHAGTDNAFRVCDANSVESFAIVYEDGIADGSECLVVVGGRCQVLLKDATASTRNNWVGVSDVAGRADATGASPPAQPDHFKEVGHCIESKGADTDVLAYMIMHHN